MATSVGTISSAGIGSGLDVAGMVSKLMAIEQIPLNTLSTTQQSYQTKISDLGQVTSAMSSLQTAAQAVANPSAIVAVTGSVADSSIASVTVAGGAAPTSFSLEVTALASQHKLTSADFSSSTASLGTGSGSIQIEFGAVDSTSGAFVANTNRAAATINLTADQMTVSGVRDAINSANIGVTASLLNDGSGTRIVLTNNQSGSQQFMRITTTDPDGNNTDASGLSTLAYDPSTTAGATKNMTQLAAAGDAAFKIDGIASTSSSNTVSNVIDGVTLNLTKQTVSGSPTTVTIKSDSASLLTSINTLVTAYNALNTQLRSLTAYDATNKTAGDFMGDATVQGIQRQMRSIVSGAYGSGTISRMADIGLSVQTDGSLKLDTTKFNAAFAKSPSSVVNLFTKNAAGASAQGMGGILNSTISSIIGTTGTLTAKTTSLNKQVTGLSTEMTAMKARLASIQARYQAQFTALDTTISNAQSLSDYLTQQIASLNNTSSTSNTKIG